MTEKGERGRERGGSLKREKKAKETRKERVRQEKRENGNEIEAGKVRGWKLEGEESVKENIRQRERKSNLLKWILKVNKLKNNRKINCNSMRMRGKEVAEEKEIQREKKGEKTLRGKMGGARRRIHFL